MLIVLLGVILLVLRKSPPPTVDTSPTARQDLQAKLEEERKAADAGQPHALKMNEAELNSLLSSNLALAPAARPAATASREPAQEESPQKESGQRDPASIEEAQSTVRDVKVRLLEDRVAAYVVFAVHGMDLSLQLEGRLGVRDGYLRFEPTAGTLGSLPLPQVALNSAVARLFDSPENRERFRVPAEVADIRVEKYELVVSYR